MLKSSNESVELAASVFLSVPINEVPRQKVVFVDNERSASFPIICVYYQFMAMIYQTEILSDINRPHLRTVTIAVKELN